MERTMSVEEKIRRAEQIYERRRQGNVRQVATVNVNDKKDFKLLKKLLIQVLLCSLIYTAIYAISKNNYPFSNDFMNKANEILSYDTNFIELYENIKGTVSSWFNGENNNEENTNPEGSIGGAEEDQDQNQEKKTIENIEDGQESADKTQESTQLLSQSEQDIIDVKNTTTFIKPVEGFISSKYGPRPNATGSVPKNHTGVDIAANLGTKIKSATDGEVVLSSLEGDYRKTFKNTNRRSKYNLCAL